MRNAQNFVLLSQFEKTILSLVALHSEESHIEHLGRAFKAMDTSNNGILSKQEVRDGMKRAGTTT